MKKGFFILMVSIIFFTISIVEIGCAQIGYPTGGARDTVAPVLVKATPEINSKNIKTDRFSFTFNEYIDLADLQENLVISPLQNKNPNITANPKTINFKFRDSLLPNTTYTINFGNAVRDINEANILKNFTYVFSTGNTIDSGTISGNIYLAEDGKTDSTLLVMLYETITDSTVKKKKPNYISKVKADGSFEFKNLPSTDFNIYGLKDADGGKTYNLATELFAFKDATVSAAKNESVLLFAYAEKKEDPIKSTAPEKINKDKKLTYATNLQGTKDIFEPIEIVFNNAIKILDSNKLVLTDTFYKKKYPFKYTIDSTLKKLTINAKLELQSGYIFLLDKAAIKDTFNKELSKSDTLKINTKTDEEYGKVVFNFSNLELKKRPVLQFFQNNTLKYSYKLTSNRWNNNLFLPGDYEIRILYDTSNDGLWTPGNYTKKIQPEIAVSLPQTLNIKANWDNERDINL